MSDALADADSRELWWHRETHPRDLLEFLEVPHCGCRKWRLFMCACGRRCWTQTPSGTFRNAVEIGEAYADGELSQDVMQVTALTLHRKLHEHQHPSEQYSACAAAVAVVSLGGDYLFDLTIGLIDHVAETAQNQETEFAALADLLRDIFGNPFRPVTFASEWCTDTATAIARGMYDSRDFGAMPILADALQDAGCDNPDILSHCRNEGVHVRGCWVVDLVLGKT